MDTLKQRVEHDLGGRYALKRELGQGGMAIVFLADDLRHDRKVALKVLRPEISAEIGADRFAREIKMAAGLTHPHILPLYDSGIAGGLLFYVMPNMEGRSLRERLDKERQLGVDEVLRLTGEIASALDYAHRSHVVHRDIKPENILLHEGSAMVADFGIGKALSEGGSITQTGMLVGTPTYMSPEQSSGEAHIDGRSDLYSLACVVYEMLSGEPPFTGASAQAIIAKRLMSPVPRLSTLREVPGPIEAAVTRALARTPADRFTTVTEFSDALRVSARERGTPARSTPTPPRGAPALKAIAVLPLTNMSADPENEYFSDGMTEEIINALAKVPGLQVASRTSSFAFKGKRDTDVREIGDKLGVSVVLEGSVRKIGQRIRITAQLVNVENGYHLWSETYDRQLEDVFAIQDEISRAIVDALKVRLVGEDAHLVAPMKNLDAYTTYLKGRYNFNKYTEQGLRKALELFESALKQDPGFARAYAGIADTWIRLSDDWVAPADGYPRAKAAASSALERDPENAEAMTSLGKVLVWHEWQFVAGVRELERAVALAPNYGEAQFVLGSALPLVGRLNDGIDALRKALVLDPLSADYSSFLARFLLYARDNAGAIAQGEKTLETRDEFQRAFVVIGSAYLAQGDAQAALDWYQRGQSLEGAVRVYDAMIVRALAALGRHDEAAAILARLDEESRHQYVRAEYLAMGFAAMGDVEKAFDALERAYQARSGGLIYLHLDPGYEPLHADPRFGELVRKIGLK